MPRESKKVKVERGIELCRRMHELYPSVQSAHEEPAERPLTNRNPLSEICSLIAYVCLILFFIRQTKKTEA